ncbi:MAG TPA: ATP-binding protein [Planctomycetota bacterium]|nr:ATP-binding protein [Planctomycetota bacterium]
MPSARLPERHWSLTSRLAWRFATMTSVIVFLYAAGSSYVLFDALRDDLHNFFDHESEEFTAMLLQTDGTPAALQQAAESVADVTHEPPCGYRVRDAQTGAILAQAGRQKLLDRVPDAIPIGERSMSLSILRNSVVGHARALPDRGLVVELLVDAQDVRGALFKYLRSALLVFLISVPVAAVCGMVTARRGLQALRDLVAQARAIELPGGGARLAPEDAPEELRELTAEINAMLARIEDGLHAMRTFTASLAHELRSPLQNLIGETEVALLASRSADDYVTLLRSNLDDLHELSDAVDNLVAFCRSSEPQPRGAVRERFDLLSEADLRLARERRTARRVGSELHLTGGGDTTLVADREDVLRVLRNLVGNALAWSPAGAAVDVRVEGAPAAVRLVVEDRGPGIPAELSERIFEPFVSGRARRGERGGYGLGLTICRTAVSAHGGRLWHEAREGGGTRFVAEFPRAAA